MKKQRKNNTEKMKNQKISWLAKAVYAAAAILAVAPTANAMHIMEGYLPPAFCMGHCLSAVFSIWISIAEQESEGKPQIHYTDRNGRSFCICAVIPENPFCDRKLFPYDRNRSWCNPVWTMCSECTWNHCSDLPGSVARPWRTDNTWSKLFFHGDYRSDPVLADL